MYFICTTCRITFTGSLQTPYYQHLRTKVFVYPACPVCQTAAAVFVEDE